MIITRHSPLSIRRWCLTILVCVHISCSMRSLRAGIRWVHNVRLVVNNFPNQHIHAHSRSHHSTTSNTPHHSNYFIIGQKRRNAAAQRHKATLDLSAPLLSHSAAAVLHPRLANHQHHSNPTQAATSN